MPDWFTHMGLAYFLATLFRVKHKRLVLIGAVLPDLARISWLVTDFLGINDAGITFMYGEPLHTPFISALLALALAIPTTPLLATFWPIFFGALTHFLADSLQFYVNFGIMWLYPISLQPHAFNLVHTDSWSFFFVGLAFFILSYFMEHHEPSTLHHAWKRAPLLLIPLLLVTLTIASTAPTFIDKNIYNMHFFTSPEDHLGETVGFYITEVTHIQPFTVKELGHEFFLEGTLIETSNLKTGDFFSFRGTYEGNRTLHVTEVYNDRDGAKAYLSLLGLFLFPLFWRFRTLRNLTAHVLRKR